MAITISEDKVSAVFDTPEEEAAFHEMNEHLIKLKYYSDFFHGLKWYQVFFRTEEYKKRNCELVDHVKKTYTVYNKSDLHKESFDIVMSWIPAEGQAMVKEYLAEAEMYDMGENQK